MPLRLKRPQGFTLLELMLVMAVLSVLAAIAYPTFGAITRRAEDITALGRLKRLHTALDSYTQERGHWPQVPEEVLSSQNESEIWRWWHGEMEEFGISKKDWLNPVEEKALEKAPLEEQPEYHSSFIPTLFDAHRITPYRWPQPWLIERGDFSGQGPRMLMPDGSIRFAPANWSGP